MIPTYLKYYINLVLINYLCYWRCYILFTAYKNLTAYCIKQDITKKYSSRQIQASPAQIFLYQTLYFGNI